MAVADKVQGNPPMAGSKPRSKKSFEKTAVFTGICRRVQVHGGKVELFGRVKTQEEKALATTIAGTVAGVASVSNQIIVRSTLPERRSDKAQKALEGVHGPTPF